MKSLSLFNKRQHSKRLLYIRIKIKDLLYDWTTLRFYNHVFATNKFTTKMDFRLEHYPAFVSARLFYISGVGTSTCSGDPESPRSLKLMNYLSSEYDLVKKSDWELQGQVINYLPFHERTDLVISGEVRWYQSQLVSLRMVLWRLLDVPEP